MDIPIPVTPELFDLIHDGEWRSCAMPEKADSVQRYIIRGVFTRWFNTETAQIEELVCSYYGLKHAMLAQFRYMGCFCPRTRSIKPTPLPLDTVPRTDTGDIPLDYYVTVAIRKLYYSHDVYMATVPLHEVEMLVSAPSTSGRLRVCNTSERPDGRLNAPLLFERVLSVRALPLSELRNTPAEDVLGRVRFATSRLHAYTLLRGYIQSQRRWMPKHVENAPKRNTQLAGDIAKQWLYWAFDVGAEHTRCSNYALLCMLYGAGCIELMPDHAALEALVYLSVLHPEALAIPETLSLLCSTLKRSFPRVASALEGGSILPPRGKKTLTKAVRFARHVLADAEFEEVAEQYERLRERMALKCSRPETRALRALHLDDNARLWNVWSMRYRSETEEAESGNVARKMESAVECLTNGFQRAQSRSCDVPTALADWLVLRGHILNVQVETDSAEPRAGMQHMVSAAAQVDRYCLVELLMRRYKPLLVQVIHYQLQIAGVQTCVREHGLPYVVVCPNLALTEQARHQWEHSRVMCADRFVEALGCARAERLVFPGGMQRAPSMIVLLHSEMYGIEAWLAMLRAYAAAVARLSQGATGLDAVERIVLSQCKPVVIAVTDVFMYRPVVVRHRPPFNSVYGTENVILQLAFCEDLFAKETVLTETDVEVHAERIPFKAAQLYYELTNARDRSPMASRVQMKLMRFLRALVENMWLENDALYSHLEMQLDGLNLPKIYMHTGFSNLTDRAMLQEGGFRENDYIHVCDTGELLALRVARVAGQNSAARFKVREVGAIALQADAFETAYLCECQQAVFTTQCSRYRYDAESPWYLHDAESVASTTVDLGLLERIEQADEREDAAVQFQRMAPCVHSSACMYPTNGAKRRALLCSTHSGEAGSDVAMMGPPAHEVVACTREMPVSVSSYTGPSPSAVYVNVAQRTPVERFLRACSIPREHVQVVYSEQKREETDSTERRGAMRMEHGTDNYVAMLREAKAHSTRRWEHTVDTIVNSLADHIGLHVTLYPQDGLWAREMQRLCAQQLQCEESE